MNHFAISFPWIVEIIIMKFDEVMKDNEILRMSSSAGITTKMNLSQRLLRGLVMEDIPMH